MKKQFLLLLMVLLTRTVHAQVYAYFKLTPPSSATSCDGELDLITNATPPYQVVLREKGSTHLFVVGYGTHLSGVCAGHEYFAEVVDHHCVRLNPSISIDTLPENAYWLDSLHATMPSGTCNGELFFYYQNLPSGSYNTLQTPTATISASTTDSTFSGLCADLYTMSTHVGSGSIDYHYFVDVYLNPAMPSPCIPYSLDIVATTSPACDGAVVVTPSSGVSGFNYLFFDSEENSLPIDVSQNYMNDICPGVYSVLCLPVASNKYYTVEQVFYADSLSPTPWSAPEIIPPSTDTIILPAISNCDIDYYSPIDTAYTDNWVSLGSDEYSFDIVIVQHPDTFFISSMLVADTSYSIFISVTLYCDDTTLRSGPSVSSNLIYHRGSASYAGITPQPSNSESTMVVYPNPAEEKLFVNANPIWKTIQVLSPEGKIMYSNSPNAQKVEINLEGWPQSVYIIRGIDENGRIALAKFIKM